MNQIGGYLIPIGLLIDIVGAAIIALPDISFFKRYHKGGRLQSALQVLNMGVLQNGHYGYDDLINLIRDMSGEKKSVTTASGVNLELLSGIVSGNGFENFDGVIVFSQEKQSIGQDGVKIDHDGGYAVFNRTTQDTIRLVVRDEIEKSKSKIRGFGFLILSSGFLLQLAGQIL